MSYQGIWYRGAPGALISLNEYREWINNLQRDVTQVRNTLDTVNLENHDLRNNLEDMTAQRDRLRGELDVANEDVRLAVEDEQKALSDAEQYRRWKAVLDAEPSYRAADAKLKVLCATFPFNVRGNLVNVRF